MKDTEYLIETCVDTPPLLYQLAKLYHYYRFITRIISVGIQKKTPDFSEVNPLLVCIFHPVLGEALAYLVVQPYPFHPYRLVAVQLKAVVLASVRQGEFAVALASA
jgi:hypothetical protein